MLAEVNAKPVVVSGCGNAGERGGVIFRDGDGADWLVAGELPETTRVPRERRIFFIMEPPMVCEWKTDFLNQFGVVVSPYEIEGFDGRNILGPPPLGWWVGGPTDNFDACRKTKEISVVSSLKKKKFGHRRRVAFVYELMKRFGGRIDYFGRDLAPVEDKFDAIAPYKYHIAIENCNLVNYWTEKLADAWIGWSLPIYCGDPSIMRQVPDPLGLEVVDISDAESALRHIEYILKRDIYASRLEAIARCREWAIETCDIRERVRRIITSSGDAAKSAAPLASAERLIPDWKKNKHTIAGELEGARSWCLGAVSVWKVKRAYRKIKGRNR